MARKSSLDARAHFGRYLRAAERTMPPPEEPGELPSIRLDVAIFALAKLHSSMQHKLSSAEGRAMQATLELNHAKYQAQKTQEYLGQMRGRVEQAAADGITVAVFLEQDRRRARAYWDRRKEKGVFASEPGS